MKPRVAAELHYGSVTRNAGLAARQGDRVVRDAIGAVLDQVGLVGLEAERLSRGRLLDERREGLLVLGVGTQPLGQLVGVDGEDDLNRADLAQDTELSGQRLSRRLVGEPELRLRHAVVVGRHHGGERLLARLDQPLAVCVDELAELPLGGADGVFQIGIPEFKHLLAP